MNKILSIMLLSCITIMSYAQSLESIGRQWLIANGADASKLNIKSKLALREFAIFEDDKNEAFVIVVTDKYAQYVDNRILAYSIDNVFSNPESNWSARLLQTYKLQLDSLKEHDIHPSTNKGFSFGNKQENSSVTPLLNKISWGQTFPYNETCPALAIANSHKPAGCVAVAMSQIMRYYKHPRQGAGIFAYTDGKTARECDFSSIMIDWNNIAPSYSQTRTAKEDISQVASLVGACAISVRSQFGTKSTSSDALVARAALVNNWGYSPECHWAVCTSSTATEALIREQLEKGQPVILSGGKHAFVCDGCNGAFLHYNLGWFGAGNGYYRFLLSPSLSSKDYSLDIATEIVHDIKPLHDKREVSRSLLLHTAGMLQTMLPEAEAMKVTKLKISGKLNGEDILYLRRMLGAGDLLARGMKSGVLSCLDLSKAEFVTDKNTPVARVSAIGCKYNLWGLWSPRQLYDFKRMNPELFHKFSRTNMAKGTGYKFIEKDGEYYVDFFTEAKTISPFMFSSCQNLRTIILPKNVNKILCRAFDMCNNLENVELQHSITEVETGAFADCFRLKSVVISNTNLKEVTHGLFPYKVTDKYGEYKDGKHGGILKGCDSITCKGIFLRHKDNLVRLEHLSHKEYNK